VRHLQESTPFEEVTYVLNSRIMSYILNMLIYVGMILLDNLLQCFLFIVVIDLSSNFDNTVVLICNSLFMFMIYLWIKIKLKVLLFPTKTCLHGFLEGFSATKRQQLHPNPNRDKRGCNDTTMGT
jgi:hypothetical protein